MLHTRLLEIVNSQEAWAFVGSGPSTDAGAPTWSGLIEAIASHPTLSTLKSDPAFTGAYHSGNYPGCFSLIESAVGRLALEGFVRQSIDDHTPVGDIHRLMADLPFQGYITTNYDGLLEQALSERELGWVPVGNTPEEVKKISAGANRVVWHVHGALALPDTKSKLVLTTRDYDDFYLQDSPLLRQLHALMTQRRIVIVGFGFADNEVLRLLRSIGRLTDPQRPIYAFLPKKGEFVSTIGRAVWLHEGNIDVIPYRIRNRTHVALKDLLSIYSSLSLRRSIKYRGDGATPPSYDPETTGLLIYNELVLARQLEVPRDIRAALMRARILAQLHSRGPLTETQLTAHVANPALALSRRVVGTLPDEQVHSDAHTALAELQDLNLCYLEPSTNKYVLTDAGKEQVAEHAAVAGRMEDQFATAIRQRVESICTDRSAAHRISSVAEAFLKNCVEKRALGVAMAMAVSQAAHQDYHLLALLRSLDEYLETLEDESEARCLINVIEQVLRAPSVVERNYIGVALQARFGVHLLGYDDSTLAMRMSDVNHTAFIIDSTALIALLARSSPNSDMSLCLIRELHKCESTVLTTPLLAGEVTEHLRWAQDRVRDGGGNFQSLPVLEAATGRSGQRSNAFLEGFAVELAQGSTVSFSDYVKEVCSLARAAARVNQFQIERTLAGLGIKTYGIERLAGFEPELLEKVTQHQAELQRLRETAETFTHQAQVQAEAEALCMVQGIRAGLLQAPGGTCDNAYFISNTRIIDQIAHTEIPIIMRPEAAVQWLVTLHPCSVDDMGSLTSGLLWELQERGQDLVDTQMLMTAFSPLIQASRHSLHEEVARLRALTGTVYAGAAEALDRQEPNLDLPVVLESHNAQLVLELQKALDQERLRAEAAEHESSLSQEEREELIMYRQKAKKRSRYQRRAERINEERGGNRRKKR